MRLKTGDKVIVITGSNKGKEGIIKKVLRDSDKVIVEGVNIVKKHMKPSRMNETGGILEVENPIHVSNVKVLTAKENKKTKEVKEVKTEKKATKKKGTGDK